MRLADLVDLEAQLARDEAAPRGPAAARDARIAAEGRLAGLPAAEALSRWLSALRSAEPNRLHPGDRVEAALRSARLILVVSGLALGWGAMTGLVELSRPDPVNVWSFLLGFVFLQLLLFLFTALAAALMARPARSAAPGPLRELLASLVRRLARLGLRRGPALTEWQTLGRRLRARRRLYARLEQWQLFALGQSFGVAFNVAAALALLRLITFTDVAFCWSTTLSTLAPARFHAVVSRLALPWGWAFPEAVPSLQVVEATRYWHLDGRYEGTALAPALRGDWWPFLLAALLVYGLLPRAGMLLLASWRRHRALAALPPSDAETRAVLRRLGAVDGSGAEVAGWTVVRWREAALDGRVQAALEARLGGSSEPGARPVLAAGGPAWEGGAAEVLGGAPRAGLVFLAEAHEPADAATLRFLREARQVMGPRAPVVILLGEPRGGSLSPPSPAQLAAWRTRLARLEDPYLGLEGLEPTGDAAAPPTVDGGQP
ncbi:MAG: DUF2868 domain-containing protein [Anaeromyxobacter sp.]